MVARQTSIPQPLTPFVGREEEIIEIALRLSQPSCRLLTLLGLGGSGKTRLAIEVAHMGDFSDGVYFVSLQPLRASEDIVSAIADVLHPSLPGSDDPMQQLLHYLRDKQLLLVLDNFEHLLDLNGVEIVTAILDATEQVKLLVTSRERLNLRIEHIWPVLGLSVPHDMHNNPDNHSSVKLFQDRACRIQPDFVLNDHLEAVIRICQLVDGLPLALELASAWVRVMPCATIADEIQANVDILTTHERDMPERHQSMRAVFDHSWHLLNDDERAAFRKLAVFRGEFTSDAAKQVAGASLRILASLIDKSLVWSRSEGRYDLHELVRQYAEERLGAAGEFASTLDTHSVYFIGILREREADLSGLHVLESMPAIALDFENIRAAWLHAVDSHRKDLINQAVGSLCLFCELRGRYQDGLVLLQRARESLAGYVDTEHALVWGKLLVRNKVLHRQVVASPERTAHYPTYLADIQKALSIAREHNDQRETAYCLYQLARIEDFEGHLDRSLHLYGESAQLFSALGDIVYVLMAMVHQGFCLSMQGQGEQAHQIAREALDLARTQDSVIMLIEGLFAFGWSAFYFKGDYELARNAFEEAHELAQTLEYRRVLNLILFHLGLMAVLKGDTGRATVLSNQMLALGKDLNHHDVLAFGNVIAGLTCGLAGEYYLAMAYGKQAYPHLYRPYQRFFVDLTIVIAGSGLNDNAVLIRHLIPMLELAHVTQRVVWLLTCLPCAAVLLARTNQPERAVETLALVWTHPKSLTDWLDRWRLLAQLRADLESMLGADEFEAAWVRGSQHDLAQTVQRLLSDLRPDGSTDRPVWQALAEPLSPRELEVLSLVAEGLTNQQIADQLYVGISTVKKHINHIYDKLDVRNRTSATARARDLNLLS